MPVFVALFGSFMILCGYQAAVEESNQTVGLVLIVLGVAVGILGVAIWWLDGDEPDDPRD